MIKLKAPISIQVELTEFCNHNCTHCYNYWRSDTSWQKEAEKIDGQKLLNIADKIIEAEVLHVVLTGGEPFVVPLSTLDSIVKKYRDNGVSVSINSNITLLKPEHIDFLKKYQLGVLTSVISFNEKEFDDVTLKPGSFKKFCNNLEELSKQNIYVSANMVVDKTRINQVYDTGKLVASLGAKGFCGTRMSPSNNGVLNDYATRILDKNDMSLLFDQLLAVEKDFGLTVSSLNSIPFCCVDNPEKYSALLTRSCNAGQTGAGMSANGDLRLCQHFDINTGNVLQTPLKELWNLMPSWKQEYISNSSCNSCAESQRCGGGCRENAYKLDNDLFGEDSLKRAPLKQKIKDKYLDKIESIQFNSGVKCREEDFGAILFRGSGAYAIVDGFTYAITKNLYSRPVISTKDILEIGSELSFVNANYVNRMFNNLVRNKVAKVV